MSSNSNIVVLHELGRPEVGTQKWQAKKDLSGIFRNEEGLYLVRSYDNRTLILGFWTKTQEDGKRLNSIVPFLYKKGNEVLYSRKKTKSQGKTPVFLSWRRIFGLGYLGTTESEERRHEDDLIELMLEMETVVQGALLRHAGRICRW